MLKQTISIITLIGALTLCSGVALAPAQTSMSSTLKIGYVNPNAILRAMPKYQAIKQRVQNFANEKRQSIRQQAQAFQQELANFQKRRSVMTEEARKSEKQKLGQMRANLQQARRRANQQIQQKRQSLIQPLFNKIHKAIQQVAKQRGLSYVISAGTVLYVSDSAQKKYNITQAVKSQLGI